MTKYGTKLCESCKYFKYESPKKFISKDRCNNNWEPPWSGSCAHQLDIFARWTNNCNGYEYRPKFIKLLKEMI